MPAKEKRAAASIARAEDAQGIEDWIRIARSDMERLCRDNRLSRDCGAPRFDPDCRRRSALLFLPSTIDGRLSTRSLDH
jgi:hypothetical protein